MTYYCNIDLVSFLHGEDVGLSPFFDLSAYVTAERKRSKPLFEDVHNPRCVELSKILQNWAHQDTHFNLISGLWLRRWARFIFDSTDPPQRIDNTYLVYSCGSKSVNQTVVLQPGLIQGIDFYLLNPSSWRYLEGIYGSDLTCIINQINTNPSRPRLPTNGSLSESDITSSVPLTESVSSISIKMEEDSLHSSTCPTHISTKLPSILTNYSHNKCCEVFTCVVCSNDSLFRCKRCKLYFYCSTTCRDIHSPYHIYSCEEKEDFVSKSQSILTNHQQPIYTRTELVREGILNTGNTCYLASSLQCLFSVAPLRHLLMSEQFRRYLLTDKEGPGCIISAVSRVFRELRFRRSFVHAVGERGGGVRSALLHHNPEMSFWGQEDAHETIVHLIDTMMEETNVLQLLQHSTTQPSLSYLLQESSTDAWTAHCSRLLSPLTPVFSFLLRSTSTCGSCGNACISHQSVTSISLPLPLHDWMLITVILYPPLLITTTHIFVPPPKQFSLQVKKNVILSELQELLSLVDSLHLPPSFYSIQTAANGPASTQDWVNGMLTEGKNLICRVMPSSQSNVFDPTWLQKSESESENEGNRERELLPTRWFIIQVIQEGRLKKLPRMIIVDPLSMSVTQFVQQISSIYNGVIQILLKSEGKKHRSISLMDQEGQYFITDVLHDALTVLTVIIRPDITRIQLASSYSSYSSSPPIPSSLPFSLFSLIASLTSPTELQRFPSLYIDPKLSHNHELRNSALSLQECLDSYFRQEVMGFSAEYTCEKCHRVVEVLRDLQMHHPPQVLILHLMRFAYDTLTAVKLYEDVKYPIIGLDCSVYFGQSTGSVIYDLICVVNHVGSTGGGHYVAYINTCIHPDDPSVFEWVCYNDTKQFPLKLKHIEDNRDAYVLFYQLRQHHS